MIQALIALAALSACQDTKNPTPPDDDEIVAGFPDGEPRPLPDRVKWNLADAISAKTSKRERIDLSGFWRFAAVDEQEATVKRSDMGWIEMPALPSADGTTFFDGRFRDCDGLWRGKPLEKYAFVWIERDIQITNSDALEWLNRRIYLVLKGPWADAEVFASQRTINRAAEQKEAENNVHVHVEPVTGIDRSGARWCDITEQLIYPGTTQISLRIKIAKPTSDPSQELSSEPYIGLERWPTGCRIDSMRVERNDDTNGIKATLMLERPQGYMILGMPPVRTIPMSVKIRLECAETNAELAEFKEDIGPLSELKRTVTLPIRWSPKDGEAPRRVRLHAQLVTGKDGVFDEPFPIEFRPADLDH